jgi:hypothetical protein
MLSFVSMTSSIKFEGRGFGYFGDQNEKLKEIQSKHDEEKAMRVPP